MLVPRLTERFSPFICPANGRLVASESRSSFLRNAASRIGPVVAGMAATPFADPFETRLQSILHILTQEGAACSPNLGLLSIARFSGSTAKERAMADPIERRRFLRRCARALLVTGAAAPAVSRAAAVQPSDRPKKSVMYAMLPDRL